MPFSWKSTTQQSGPGTHIILLRHNAKHARTRTTCARHSITRTCAYPQSPTLLRLRPRLWWHSATKIPHSRAPRHTLSLRLDAPTPTPTHTHARVRADRVRTAQQCSHMCVPPVADLAQTETKVVVAFGILWPQCESALVELQVSVRSAIRQKEVRSRGGEMADISCSAHHRRAEPGGKSD